MFTTDNETLNEIIKLIREIANETSAWRNENGSIELSRRAFEDIQFYINELDKEND